MAVINQSYEILIDPNKRREHDAWIVREEAKLRQQSAGDAQAAPIPPQWRATKAAPTVKNSSQQIFVAVLLWPLKLLRRIVIAVPQLAILGVLIGAIALYDAVTPKRPPPSGPKPYKAEVPAQPKPAVETNLNTEVSDCRIVSNYTTKSGHGAPIYSYMKDGAKHYTSRKPLGCNVASSSDYAAEDIDPTGHASSAAAPNGSPWPTKAAYIPGYSNDNNSGYSQVTVDNAQNSSDVLVKLVSLNDATAYPVRQLFIPAGSSFTMNKVTAGKYDIRYRDLETGGLSRSESFDVEEMQTEEGVQFSNFVMTLYKVQGGNFQTYELAESEF
jgi:hypothetical protein